MNEMNLDSNIVVGGSYYMEKEGLKCSLALLEANGVTLDCIVTDRHPQVQKYLRKRASRNTVMSGILSWV